MTRIPFNARLILFVSTQGMTGSKINITPLTLQIRVAIPEKS
jgi:hypothetical protein